MTLEISALSCVLSRLKIRRLDAIFLAVCLVFLYLHLFILPNTPIYYEMDHVALLNDAKRMIEGEVIYRDFFEFTFPGSHSLYAIFLSIFGTKYWVANFLILLHGMAAAVLALFISRRVIADNLFAYLPPTIFIFLGFRWFGIDGEHRMFSPLFAYLAVLFLLSKRTILRIAAAGIACGFSSFFTQQRGVLTASAIGLYLFIEIALVEREWRRFAKSAVIFSLCFAGSLALLLLPFVVAAGQDRFYDCTIRFLANYVEDPSTNGLQTYLGTLAKVRTLGLLMTAVAVFYYLLVPLVYCITLIYLRVKRKNSDIRYKDGVLLVCLVGLFLSLGTLAPNAPRIFQISLPALILFSWMIYQLNFKTDVVAKVAVIALICFGLVLAGRLQFAWDAQTLHTPSGDLAFLSPVVLERYAWLDEHTQPNDYIYETYNAHVNFPLHLRNPSRISILLNTGYTPHDQVMQAIEDLKRRNARYIIWDGAWNDEMRTLGDDEKLKPFYLYMTSNYRFQKNFSPYDGRSMEIWERMDRTRK